MTVGEVIQALQQIDPDLPAFFHRPDTTMCVLIRDVQLGNRWTDRAPGALLMDERWDR